MRIACLGGGPAGLYFAIAMKRRDPGARDRRGRAQPALRHVRLGRGAVGRDARQSRRCRSRECRDDPPRVRLLGRHRRLLPRHGDALVGPRLLRHRPQAAAQHPAGAGAGARRRAALRDGDRWARGLSRLRSGRGSGRRQLEGPRRAGACLQAGYRCAGLQIHLARHAPEVRRRLHLHLRGDRARLDLGARLPVRCRHRDLHRRVLRGDLAARGLRPR